MDFSNFEGNQDPKGAPCHIQDPVTGEYQYYEDKPIQVWCLSKDSKDYLSMLDAVNKRYRDMENESPSKLHNIGIEMLARSTTKLENFVLDESAAERVGIEFTGQEVEATYKNVFKIYKFFPRIREQVFNFQKKPINFLHTSGSD